MVVLNSVVCADVVQPLVVAVLDVLLPTVQYGLYVQSHSVSNESSVNSAPMLNTDTQIKRE